ncbi:MAG: pectin acetylesterase-family hydrolase [Bacteroidota bacterium]
MNDGSVVDCRRVATSGLVLREPLRRAAFLRNAVVLALAIAGCSDPSGTRPRDGGVGGADGSAMTGDAGAAIEAPTATWTWVPFADSRCGNGTPAGIGINLGTRRDAVLFYLQGGGACWDAATCLLLHLATHIEDTYGVASFNADTALLDASGVFNRADATNPFHDASWVFVPYCTGDLHFGHSTRAYSPLEPQRLVHHRGGDNMQAFLARLAVTFPAATRIWLTGSSAGGFGATFNFDAVQAAFPRAAVDLLADCSPFITPGQGRWPVMRDAWSLTFPAGCADCENGLPPFIDHLATAHRSSRLGLLAYDQDAVIGTFWGYSAPEMQALTGDLVRTKYARPAIKAFVVPGTDHVMLGNYNTLRGPDGKSLRDWVTEWATPGAAAWNGTR